jgi:hypothetical protein
MSSLEHLRNDLSILLAWLTYQERSYVGDNNLAIVHYCSLMRRYIPVDELYQRQPELNITDADMLCLEIAGLCHDLGHGPYSHLFDAKILPRITADKSNYHFEHEHASIGILDLLIKENNLLPEFKKHGLTEADIHFIKVCLLHPTEIAYDCS